MRIDLFRDKSEEFPKIDSPELIVNLRVWHCNYKTLSEISKFTNLQVLVIANYPDSGLDILGNLSKLLYLRIIHLPRVTSLEPIAALHNLETLSLEALPSKDGSSDFLIVDSLRPIAELPKLRHLSVLGVCGPDQSYAELARCENLKTLCLPEGPKKEIARIYQATRAVRSWIPEPPEITMRGLLH